MDEDFIKAQIESIKAQITAYQSVLLKIASNPSQSYTLDTGQTRETVTKFDAVRIRELVNSLIGDLEYWQMKLDGAETVLARPAW